MSENKWKLTPEQLKVLREIHANCAQNIFCNGCPLDRRSEDPHDRFCYLQGINPADWDINAMSDWK